MTSSNSPSRHFSGMENAIGGSLWSPEKTTSPEPRRSSSSSYEENPQLHTTNSGVNGASEETVAAVLLLHEHYLVAAYDSDVLACLLGVIIDLGLEKYVSLLDVERARRYVMRKNGIGYLAGTEEYTSRHMGPEAFYDWLQQISMIIGYHEMNSIEKSLQNFFINWILPYVEKWDHPPIPRIDISSLQSIVQLFTDLSLQTMSSYTDFLHLWFLEILRNGKIDGYCWKNETLWSQIGSIQSGVATTNQLVESCTRLGLVPNLVDSVTVESLVLLCLDTDELVSFRAFLLFLELLAERIDPLSLGCLDTEAGASQRLLLLIATVSRLRLESTFRNAMVSVTQVDANDVGNSSPMKGLSGLGRVTAAMTANHNTSMQQKASQENNDDEPIELTMKAGDVSLALMWWLRESGLPQLAGGYWQIILANCDTISSSFPHKFKFPGRSGRWISTVDLDDQYNDHRDILERLAYSLIELLELLLSTALPQVSVPSNYAGSTTDLTVLQLAQLAPSVLFVTLKSPPPAVRVLYSRASLQLWQLSAVALGKAIAAVFRCLPGSALASRPITLFPLLVPPMACVSISVLSFQAVCRATGIVSGAAEEATLDTAIRIVAGEALSIAGDSSEVLMTASTIVETLYCLAYGHWVRSGGESRREDNGRVHHIVFDAVAELLTANRTLASGVSAQIAESTLAGIRNRIMQKEETTIPKQVYNAQSPQTHNLEKSSLQQPMKTNESPVRSRFLSALASANINVSSMEQTDQIPSVSSSHSIGQSVVTPTRMSVLVDGERSQEISNANQMGVVMAKRLISDEDNSPKANVDIPEDRGECSELDVPQVSSFAKRLSTYLSTGPAPSPQLTSHPHSTPINVSSPSPLKSTPVANSPVSHLPTPSLHPQSAAAARQALAAAVPTSTLNELASRVALASADDEAPSPREFVRLLLHWPIASFRFSPWRLVDLISSAEKEIRATYASPYGPNVPLPADIALAGVLAHISSSFNLEVGDVSRLFAAYFRPDGASEGETAALASLLSRRRLIASAVLDELLRPAALALLASNEALLQFEFSRALALYGGGVSPLRSGRWSINGDYTNKFAGEVINPLVALPVGEKLCQITRGSELLLQREAAAAWALSLRRINADGSKGEPAFSEAAVIAALDATLCLSGQPSGRLSFSAFVVFAVRLSTAGATTSATTHTDRSTAFGKALREMLSSFASSLTQTQASLRLRVLPIIFPDSPQTITSPENTSLSAILRWFAKSHNDRPNTNIVGISLPPSPPITLWDAPRFAAFCSLTGLMDALNTPLTFTWAAFGLAQLASSPPAHRAAVAASGVNFKGNNANFGNSVTATPIAVSPSVVRSLLDWLADVAKEAEALRMDKKITKFVSRRFVDTSPEELINQVLVPLLVGIECRSKEFNNEDTSKALLMSTKTSVSLESIIRFGGGASISSLCAANDFLSVAYHCLTATASIKLFPLSSLKDLQEQTSLSETEKFSNMEAPFELVATLLSCGRLLSTSIVNDAIFASLHPRIRPVFSVRPLDTSEFFAAHSIQPTPSASITLSRSEFEEAVLRCSFAAWSTWRSGEIGRDVGGGGGDNSFAIYTREATSASRSPNTSTWGVDFVRPYLTTLSTVAQLPVASSNEFVKSGGLKLPHGAALFHDFIAAAAQRLRDEAAVKASAAAAKATSASKITKEKNSSTPSTPNISNPPTQDTSMWSSVARDGEPVASFQSMFGAATDGRRSPLTISLPPNSDSNRTVARTSELRTPSSAVSSSSSGPPTTASPNDVVPPREVVSRAKEALWPVFATFCSCGDSREPGKLSGPNLFLLLSTLGLITDTTSLASLGSLLFQIAMRDFSSTGSKPLRQWVTNLRGSSVGGEGICPALTFEDLLICLYVLSLHRFETPSQPITDGASLATGQSSDRFVLWTPSNVSSSVNGRPTKATTPRYDRAALEQWTSRWHAKMSSSVSFGRLVGEYVRPLVARTALLASPEDARLRDRFACVFSVDVIETLSRTDQILRKIFANRREASSTAAAASNPRDATLLMGPNDGGVGLSQVDSAVIMPAELVAIVVALRRTRISSEQISANDVLKIASDVWQRADMPRLAFSQWQWVLCISSLRIVETAVYRGTSPPQNLDSQNLPRCVSQSLNSLISCMHTAFL